MSERPNADFDLAKCGGGVHCGMSPICVTVSILGEWLGCSGIHCISSILVRCNRGLFAGACYARCSPVSSLA